MELRAARYALLGPAPTVTLLRELLTSLAGVIHPSMSFSYLTSYEYTQIFLSPTGTATYYKSGTANYYTLKVASNKTLLGKGSAGGMYVLAIFGFPLN
jgi:hypothetical protein